MEAYFESNGFLVRQAGDSISSGGKKTFGLPTIAIFNPMTSANTNDLSFRSLREIVECSIGFSFIYSMGK